MSHVPALPPIAGVPVRLLEAINDRLRRLAVSVSHATSSAGSSSPAAAVNAPYALWFSAPGLLATEPDAAPRQYLNDSRTATRVVAYVQTAPDGADLDFTLTLGGSDWLALSIADGEKTTE